MVPKINEQPSTTHYARNMCQQSERQSASPDFCLASLAVFSPLGETILKMSSSSKARLPEQSSLPSRAGYVSPETVIRSGLSYTDFLFESPRTNQAYLVVYVKLRAVHFLRTQMTYLKYFIYYFKIMNQRTKSMIIKIRSLLTKRKTFQHIDVIHSNQ